MNDVLKQAAEALRQAQAFIDGMRSDLHSLRATDWFPEGAHDAASSMSENMRLLGNACADFDCIGAGLAALESAQDHPLGAAIAPEHDEAMAQMAADAERAHAEMVRDAKLWRAAQERQGEDRWLPIETAPENMDRPALVFWIDAEGQEHQDIDYTEDGCWMGWHNHAEHVHMIGGHGVSDTPPYTHWQPINPPSAMRAARSAK